MKRMLGVRGFLFVLCLSSVVLTACSPEVGVEIQVFPDELNFGKSSVLEPLLIAKNYSSNTTEPITISVDKSWIQVDDCLTVDEACNSSGPSDRLRIPVMINRNALEVGLNVGNLYIKSGAVPVVTVPVTAEETVKADFAAGRTQVSTGDSVEFQDMCQVTEESGNVRYWNWNFGDGASSTLRNPAHTYTLPGVYTVSLSIETTADITRSVSKTAYIRVADPSAEVDFTASKTDISVGDVVAFTDLSTVNSTSILSRQWTFGDGSTSTAANPSHKYVGTGTYTVSLTLHTTTNDYQKIKENYIVVRGPLNADFSYENAFVDEDTQFFPFVYGNQGEVSYAWDFGDGGTSMDDQPAHRYTVRGQYEVTLTVIDDAGSNVVSKTIDITFRPPQVLFIAEPRTQSVGKEVEFHDRTIGGYGTVIEWLWTFGDGSTSKSQNPSHTYMKEGSYTVSLEVTSAPDGQKGKLVKKAYITIVEGSVEGETELDLDNFVKIDDGCFGYSTPTESSVRVSGMEVAKAYLVDEMVSQCWNPDDSVYDEGDVDYTKWTHAVTIIEPLYKVSDTAMLFIDGGSRSSEASVEELTKNVAILTGTTVVHLKNVPSEPIVFKDEVIPAGSEDNYSGEPKILRKRSEDAIIAYSYDKYMKSYRENDGSPTSGWPLLYPMVKSAVKAMDMAEEILGSKGIQLDGFVVAGASKRGWTTWLTGAVDSRIKGIAPIVINVLNMKPHLEHHRASYGYWSPAIYDYAQKGIFDQLVSTVPGEELSPEALALLSCVDPYEYALQGRYVDMPKFMLNATGDQFFVPDTTQFYFDDLPSPKHLSYVPNVGHSLGLEESDLTDITDTNNPFGRLLAWYMAVTQGVELPTFSQTFKPNGAIRVEIDPANPPVSVRLWQVTSANKRDFREGVLENDWTSSELAPISDGVYEALPSTPSEGDYKGFYIQLEYANPAELSTPAQLIGGSTPNFVFTTGVRVLPVDSEGDPVYPEFTGYLANSERPDAVPFSDAVMPVITVYGTPYEMGRHYGELLTADIAAFVPAFISAYQDSTGMDVSEIATLWNAIEPTLDTRIIEEIEGIAETSEVDLTMLQMANAAAIYSNDLWNASATMAYGDLLDSSWNAGHGVTVNSEMGRTLTDHLCSVVYIPNKGAPHTIFTYAGLAFGYTGINLGAISASEIPDPTAAVTGNAMPLMRTVLYDAFSLRDAIGLTESAPPLNTALIFGDGRNEYRGVRIRTDAVGILSPMRYDLSQEDFSLSTPGIVYDSQPDLRTDLRSQLSAVVEGFTLENLLDIHNQAPFAEADTNILNVAYDSEPLDIYINKAQGAQDANLTDTVSFNMQSLLP